MFGDWLAINMPDPDHSKGEQRYVYEEGANIVLLEPDVAAAFPNGAAVNKALRSLMHVSRSRSSQGPRRRGGHKAGASG